MTKQPTPDALDLHLNELRRLGVAVEKAHLNCGDMLWIARGRADPSQRCGGAGVAGGCDCVAGRLFLYPVSQNQTLQPPLITELYTVIPPFRYVLDFLAERKSIQDLHGSITGSRYTSQKLNMQGAGLAHLLYIVEGAVDGLSEGGSSEVGFPSTDIAFGRSLLFDGWFGGGLCGCHIRPSNTNPSARADRSARQAVRTSVMETAVLDGFRVLEVDDHGATLRLLADITK
jgi:ERCC4-type nuclease